MKAPPLLLLAVLAAVPLNAAPAAPSAPAATTPALFDRVGSDYKKPQEVPDNFFNPFKIQATGSAAPRISKNRNRGTVVRLLQLHE